MVCTAGLCPVHEYFKDLSLARLGVTSHNHLKIELRQLEINYVRAQVGESRDVDRRLG